VKQNNYKTLVYFIAATILITIAIQLYWNVRNYSLNKQRLINEVQISLDNGVEAYYSELAKADYFTFSSAKDTLTEMGKFKGLWETLNNDTVIVKDGDSVTFNTNITSLAQESDSGLGISLHKATEITSVAVLAQNQLTEDHQGLEDLANKIIISIARDTIDYMKLDTMINAELLRKNIAIKYVLKHLKNDSLIRSYEKDSAIKFPLQTFSKSTYLPENEKLQLYFTNPTLAILKRSVLGIGLSLLLSICIISCLLYLLHTIKKQKELAAIKNDLISNITHEFKTPIATVATAIEGIKNFNHTNDTEKTNSYLNISQQQLGKLNTMVEKLLETAALDSDKVLLNKEDVSLHVMLEKLVDKYRLLTKDKQLIFKSNTDALEFAIDPFHFENAVANLIDNAIKYGGNTIEIHLNSLLNSIEISVADNGASIPKGQRAQIFDKFYRIPKGNRHDVKGFGIGLYYTKKIIEKHGGQIELLPDDSQTIFKITL